MATKPPPKEKEGKSSPGFLEALLSLFIKDGDPEKEKKRLLKEIGKDLTKSKYKFYKPKTEEALPKLARFFYSIYKLTAPAAIMLENSEASGVFKSILIEAVLDEKQLALKEELEEDSIRETLKKNPDRKAAVESIKAKLSKITGAYDSEKIQSIEMSYTLFQVFNAFVGFDYYFLLRKFDSRFPERDFNYVPAFETINAEYISEDLKDFLEIAPSVSPDANWDSLFDSLALYKGSDVVSRGSWKKMVRSLGDVAGSQVLKQIVQHVDKDPSYQPMVIITKGEIVHEYMTKLKTQVEMTIQMVLKEEQAGKMDRLVQEIFGTTAVSRLNNYTEKANMSFSKKMLGGFIHVVPLNYLKAFLLDFVKKDVREVVNLLIVKGEWTIRLTSQQFSEAFASLLQVAEELVQFDDSLSAEGEAGASLWAVVKRSERDTNSATILRQKLKDINEKAAGFIRQAGQNLIVIGKNLKTCLEDCEKPKAELIVNWKALDSAAGGEIKDQMTFCYKKIYYFVQLLQYFTGKKAE